MRSIIRASDVLQDNAIRDPADFGVVSSAVCRDLRFLDTSQILAPQIIPKSVPIWTVGHYAQVVSSNPVMQVSH